MRTISVQDLHDKTDEIVTAVHQGEVPLIIKSGDHLIALLSPFKIEQLESTAVSEEPSGEGWESYSRLAEEVRARWPAGRDSRALIQEFRR